MNKINLQNLKLKTFTEQNALDYCLLNNINPLNITELDLYDNKLTDISGIKLFKNLKELNLAYNKLINISDLKYLKKLKILILFNNNIKDISSIQYLIKLRYLNINYLYLKSNQIEYIKSLKNLKELHSLGGFKNIYISKLLNKNIKIYE